MKPEKKLQKLVFDSLDAIEYACNKMAKAWKIDSIPIPTFIVILNKAKWNTDIENRIAKKYAEGYNEMIDAVKSSVALNESITTEAISEIIKRIKSSFKEGLSNATII